MTSPGRSPIVFGGDPDSFVDPGCWIILQDSLPLGDRVSTDVLQRISASYVRISMKLFGGVERDRRTRAIRF